MRKSALLPALSLVGPFLLTLLVLACTDSLRSNQPLEVLVHEDPKDDSVYHPAFVTATHTAEVYRNFETKFVVHATYFSPQFRTAFDTRLKKLMGSSPFSLGEDSSKVGFFVSIYAPDSKKVDLASQDLWNIVMENKDQQYQPSVVRHLPDKARWTPYFSYVNKWSKEYFIMFSVPAFVPQSDQMVAKSDLQLSLANAEATVVMTW